MSTQADIENDFALVVKIAGLGKNQSLISMHLTEIEAEAETVLELLTVACSHAFRGDADATQETLAELVIALEHLSDHVHHALPELQQQLEADAQEHQASHTTPKALKERPKTTYAKAKRSSRNGKSARRKKIGR
ncbi:MAG: hypothetical protein AABZ58_02310 [Chloroflexota bacterium]